MPDGDTAFEATTERIKDKVNDALDGRPDERLKDAAEDMRDDPKLTVRDLGEAGESATPR